MLLKSAAPFTALLLLVTTFSAYAETEKEKTAKRTLPDELMAQCLRIAAPRAGGELTIKNLRDLCNTLTNENATRQIVVRRALEALSASDEKALSASDEKALGASDNKALRASDETALSGTTALSEDKTARIEETTLATKEGDEADNEDDSPLENNLLSTRLGMEALNRSNRFLLTPHRRNYVLPLSYQEGRNTAPYAEAGSQLASQDNIELEFQLSLKILIREGVFGDNGHLYVAYTNRSLWQAYHQDISRPFRETNHQPELILSFINDWEIFGFRNVLNEITIAHQSNGQSGVLSRSWDRILINSVFERGPFVFSFTPWYRVPESEGDGPGDPSGDDNPDIEKYLGHFELSGAYERSDNIFSMMVRNNLRSDNRGAVELGWSFPVSSTTRGYLKVFNGYGHSLIDYNHHTTAIGLGVIFTDLF